MHHLKQIGLAFHNMHDVAGYFPSALVQKGLCDDFWRGRGETNMHNNPVWDNAGRIAWTVPLLPYMEQNARYDVIVQFAHETETSRQELITPYATGATVTVDGVAIQNPYAGNINLFVCPSEQTKNPVNGSIGVLSYQHFYL